MKKTAILFIFIAILLGWYMVASAGEVGDGFNGVSFRPVLEYRTVDTAYAGWNTFWLTAAIVGQAADIASTSYGLNHGAEEANPLFGKEPDLLLMIGVKAALVGGVWLITEYAVPEKDRRELRNYAFAPLAFIGCGVSIWNMAQVQ